MDYNEVNKKVHEGTVDSDSISNSRFKEQKCLIMIEKLHSIIKELWNFIEEHIPLANTHGAEFISFSHWEKFVPSQAQEKLLTLTQKELVNLTLGVTCTLQPSFKMTGLAQSNDKLSTKNEGSRALEKDWLESFLRNAYKFHLQNMGVLDDEMIGDIESESNSEVISEAMSEKKCHEVELLSRIVKQAFDVCHADVVVDLGSGKGYLSTELSRQHLIPVLGMDSSELNTHGAVTRDSRLGKKWRGLEQRQKAKQNVNTSLEKKNRIMSLSRDESLLPNPSEGQNVSTLMKNEEKPALMRDRLKNSSDKNRCTIKTKDCGEGSYEIRFQELNSSELHCDASIPLSRNMEAKETKSDQPRPESGKFEIESKELSDSQLYVPLTLYVHPEIDLRQVLKDKAPHLRKGKDVDALRLLVTGLHTCGSLAVTGMRLFLQDPAAVGLCLVGCCYQLMDEAHSVAEETKVLPGFPLSNFGKDIGLHLGRNARNLASQSVHRIQVSGQLQGGDFYWRALLDVLLRDLEHPVPERIVGMRGLNKRSKCFYDYVVGAFKKLGLNTEKVTLERAQALEAKYKSCQQQMTCFFQLKLALAPVIESLILLDRYLFLLEQECVASASLVQLFDPKTSPRCFAIMATKVKGV